VITADTISDEQIRELRDTSDNQQLKAICNLAFLAPNGIGAKEEYRTARAKCACILNERAKGKRGG